MARREQSTHALSDHEEIRRWAEERGAHPACVRGTGDQGDVGMIRLDFPGYSGENSLQEISWDDWFQKFDESNLMLLVQEETAAGETSNFNKLVSRETANAKREAGTNRNQRSRSRRASQGSRSASGERVQRRSTANRGSASSKSGQRSGSKRGGRTRETARMSARTERASSRTSRGRSSGNSRTSNRAAGATGKKSSSSARSSRTSGSRRKAA